MEIQPGVFVYDAARRSTMRLALEHMRMTLSHADWVLLQEEMQRMGMSVPTQSRKSRTAFQEPSYIFKTLLPREMEKVGEDICAICCENHQKKESLTTSCGHCFGRECFKEWINIRKTSRMELTCPLCKTEVTCITTYHSNMKK
jgi:hypothetical protein